MEYLNKSRSLDSLLSVRQMEIESALSNLQHIQQQFLHLRQRREQLEHYRKDYEQQLYQLGSKGCNIAQMRNRLDFVHHLDIALGRSGQQLTELVKQRNQADQKVQEARKAEKIVRKLIEKERESQQKQENHREQKENDELGQKQWYSKLNRSKKFQNRE